MTVTAEYLNNLSDLCASTPVTEHHELLLKKLARVYPHLDFRKVLTRGGWHRSGGILSADGERIAVHRRDWLEQVSDSEFDDLLARYAGSGYIATTCLGKTHYFVAPTGDRAQAFIQLEVEEIQEVRDHVMFDPDNPGDDLEDLMDPADAERLAPDPVGEPRYVFRRITAVPEFMERMKSRMLERGNRYQSIQRFMQDWDRSSSHETGPFCYHWVLSLQEYSDVYGEPVMQARPVSTFIDAVPPLKLNGEHRGAHLANLIHGFDHDIGYPMAWYFYMLSHSEVPHQLAANIHQDQMGAYDYLPPRDLKVLKDWTANPYGI